MDITWKRDIAILITVIAASAAPSVAYADGAEELAAAADSISTGSRDASTLGEVVVTGTQAGMRQELLPYTVSVVGPRELEATGQTQVLSAISGMIPSLFVTQRSIYGFGVSNGGSGHIKLRGAGGDRASAVLMMVDGQPQFAGIYSHHIADFYSKSYVERVEVLRGPGSVLYGSNAMAGAINVITKQAGKDGVKGSLQSQYGSYNTWLSSLDATARYGKVSALLSIGYGRSDGNIKNFDFKQGEGYAKVGYDFSGEWKASIDYTLMNFRGNDPIYPTLSDPESTAIYQQNIIRGEASGTVSNDYGRYTGAARVYYSYGNHFIDDPTHFHSTDDRLGVLLYENIGLWKGASGTIGFDFDTYSGRIPMSGGRPVSPENKGAMVRKRITEYSPYLTLSQQLAGDLLHFSAGLRMANSSEFDTQWIPQFGVSVNINHGWTFKGNLAMGYRNPSFRELYLYRMANPELQPEKMMNYELSVRKSFGRYLAAELTGYYSKGSNLIQQVDMHNENTGRFINKGLELTLSSHPIDRLWINGSYSCLDTSVSDLTGAPAHQYYIGLEWRPIDTLSISADVKGVAGLFVAKDMEKENYALLNCKVSYDVCKYVTLFLHAENITDVKYTINRGYEMPGITVLGGARFNLEL